MTADFPALRNGPTWVAGFKPIVQYLQRHSASEHNPDEHLTERERSDTTAYAPCRLQISLHADAVEPQLRLLSPHERASAA